jgi:hypothetical protein
MSWMTLTGGIVGFLGLVGIVAAYAVGMAADRRSREQQVRGRRDYLGRGEELVEERRAA